MEVDDSKIVRALLAAAGVAPTEDEVEEMVRSYSALRREADSMYRPEAGRFLPAFFPTDEDLEAR